MTTPRDLVADARTMAAFARPRGGIPSGGHALAVAGNLLAELADEIEARTERHNHQVVRRRTAERTIEALWKSRANWMEKYRRRDLLARLDRTARRDQLTAVRSLASQWVAQVPVDDAAVQQIEDGCALLLLIDGRTLPEETPNA
ncbi:hypothetical protein ACTWPB_07490 [Nocardia sp. IBHARD005]|uniref:hypothetical protein n=1 Tax=Nocardia sp. IBHARD005 TaxID=3457765 RepID=UPI0040582DA2